MKRVDESLIQFRDNKFFGSLLEADAAEKEDLSPAEKEKLKAELQKQGMAVVKKCMKNFSEFKKFAGDIWQEYRDFWNTQLEADNTTEEKGMYYNLFKSDYVVGVIKEANGEAYLKVFNTSVKDEDEWIAFKTKNKEVVKAFVDFLKNDVEGTMKSVISKHKEKMAAKKAADEANAKAESENKKKEKLSAFLGESEKNLNEGSYEDFFMNYGYEIKNAIQTIKQIHGVVSNDEISEEELIEQFERLEKIYDGEVIDYIASAVYSGQVNAAGLAETALNNMNSQGTEMQMIIYAIDELGSALGI